MKSKSLYLILGLALAVTIAGCGKQEEAPATAETETAAGKTVDPATAGRVTGTVKLDGQPPRPGRLRMDADPFCARAHSSAVTSEEVVTGPNNELANVVVYVKSGLEDYSFPAPTEAVVLDQHGCMYEPHVMVARTGQKIEILNSDQTTHNIHPVPANNREWNKSQPPGGAKLEEAFAREEVAVPVKCNVHPWMKSYIAVLRHPYGKVTGTDGSFTLADLPPGTYTLEAWHEKYGSATQQVTLGANETKLVEFVFKAS